MAKKKAVKKKVAAKKTVKKKVAVEKTIKKKVAAKKSAQKPSKKEILTYLRQMMEIRFFEDKVYELLGMNIIKGASHLYAGQEAVAVGAIAAIREDDLITSTHRGHGHCHARGDALAHTPKEKQNHLNRMMAELCGKATGYCKGRGGSMHIADVHKGNLGATGIVGGNIPVATGAALAVQMRGEDHVVLCFFGDGATNTGTFHEAINMGSTWGLPVVYICENNLYGMSVPFNQVCRIPHVAHRASAYGIKGMTCDGMDVLAVKETIEEAAKLARDGKGPVLVEAQTYRWYGHSRSDPRKYRTKEEEAWWHDRCPIKQFKEKLIKNKWATQKEIDAIEEKAVEAIDISVDFSMKSPDPDPREVMDDVYAPTIYTADELEAERVLREKVRQNPGDYPEKLFKEALSDAVAEEMERDSRVFVMGEDVGLYGGAYGATSGLFDRFGPERVRDTAISEAAIAGAGVGAAMAGMRPISEIMYVDFTPLSMDQLANQGAKNRYMFGGKTTVPMVLRSEGGAGRCIAAHHSQSLEALWMHFPGIYVVMPSTPYDAKGLLKASIRDDNPIMFIEHKMLYGDKGPVPEEDYIIPLGVADIKREGSDVTIVSYSRMVLRSLEAAELLAQDGIDAEVIDLRTLKPLDTETVVNSIKKTNRLVVVSEGYSCNGFCTEMITLVNELAFDYLDAPMVRVASLDVPVPMSQTLEDEAIPSVQKIVDGVKKIV